MIVNKIVKSLSLQLRHVVLLGILSLSTQSLAYQVVDCSSNCEMSCISQVNLSLDQDCSVEFTPAMGSSDIGMPCNDFYNVVLSDSYGNIIPDNILTDFYAGETLSFEIIDPSCGNSCWGSVLIEDKFPPVLTCNPGPFFVPCNGIDQVPAPTAEENCTTSRVVLIGEVEEQFECETYTGKVTRTYVGVDDAGNQSAVPCVQEIYITRPDLSQITSPATAVISCNENYVTDVNGNPAPWVSPDIGSGTGVPILCVPGFNSGVACHTGSGAPMDGVYMIPGPQDQICNTFVSYEDTLLPTNDCSQKIMRRFEIREWWCGGELQWVGTQFIEIVDDVAPLVSCPSNFTVSTDFGCNAEVVLPPVSPSDACGAETSVKIQVEGKGTFGEDDYFPGAFLESNGGEVTLPVGPNIITYLVYDECYNSSSCSMVVTVKDNTQPVAICESNTIVSLPSSGNIEVWAQSFDDGSFDECGLASYEVTRMASTCNIDDVTVWDEMVSFCCSDVGTDVMVALRVTDTSGNTNICMTSVTVQDKTIPSISCPNDLTITCLVPYDLTNLTPAFGGPVIDDNCMTEDFEEEVVANINSCGTGTIIRDFTIKDINGNVVAACQQEVTVVIDEPMVESDIIWPANEEFFDICNTADAHPDLIGYPEVLEGVCDLVGFNYTDEVFSNIPNSAACAKILRTWKVINWCQIDANGDITVWDYVQVIELFNTIDPVISTACDKIIATSNSPSCADVFVALTNTATDDCTPEGQLTWSWTIDIDADGNPANDVSGTGNDASGNYPIGDHILSWTVTDLCGNADFCDQLVSIVNTKGPSAICKFGLSSELIPMDVDLNGTVDTEMAVLWAEDFDAESMHTCGYDVFLSFSADINDTQITFGCNDVGMQTVELWVTDENGGTAICETFVNITNNVDEGLCGSLTDMVDVEGRVATELDKEIASVHVSLEGSSLSDMTDSEGEYSFNNMPMGGAYKVKPSKNDDILNGVSTLDIILIQRHILSLATLTSPYQQIAADINKSGSITALDLIELRKVILGLKTEFGNNDSWRFIDADYEFNDILDPLTQTINEDYNIPALSNDMLVDFIGVKIGDVNGSVVVGEFASENIESRTASSLKLEGTFDGSQLVIRSKYADQIRGMQFTMEFPNELVDILSVDSKGLNIESDSYHIDEEEGYFTLVWYTDKVKTIKSGDELFVIQLSDELVAHDFKISSKITKSEAYSAEFEIMDISYEAASNYHDIQLLQNEPNPWVSSTSMTFELDKAEEVIFSFRNLEGKLLYNKAVSGVKGMNEFLIHSDDIQNYSGVLYYEMQTSSKRIMKKMIRIQ